MNGEQTPVIHVPHNSLGGWLGRLAQIEQAELAARRRRKISTRVAAIVTTIGLATAGYLVAEHEKHLNHDSKEISALVRAQGYINAKAIKPIKGDEAYITLWMKGCEVGQADMAIDNVTATIKQVATGSELEFSRINRENKVDGQWIDSTQTWVRPEEFCALQASE